MVAVGTLSKYEHVTQALAVWPCLPCCLCLDSGISVDLFGRKKKSLMWVVCSLGSLLKERHSQRQRDFYLPTSYLTSEINFMLYGASWEGPHKRVSCYVLLGWPFSYLDREVSCTTRDKGESILDLKRTQINKKKGTTSSYWARHFFIGYWFNSYINYLRQIQLSSFYR